MNFTRHKKIVACIILATMLGVLPLSVSAESTTASPDPSGLSWFAYTMSVVGYTMLTIVLKGVGLLANLLQGAIRIPVDITVVQAMWQIVRDFCNIFFILILIIMAFATIFDIGGYNLNAGLLVRVIVVALLINFSLVLSQVVIDGFNSINTVFINSLGDIGARFATIFNAQQLLGNINGQLDASGGCFFNQNFLTCARAASGAAINSDLRTWNLTFQVLISLILSIVAFVSLLAPAVFALVRVPFLWFLIIFSPLAGLASILPATRSGWEKWTKEFFAWNTYLPLNLLALYFGVYFLSQQNTVISRLQTALPASFWSDPLMGIGYSFQFLFFYVIAAIVLIGGTGIALSISRQGGTMAVEKGAKWAGAVSSSTMAFLGRTSRVTPLYEGAKEGLSAKGERIRQEGIFGIGGQLKTDQFRGRVAEGFGAIGAIERQKKEAVKYFKEQQQKQGKDTTQLVAISQTAKQIEERLAAYENLKDDKALSGAEMLEAYNTYLLEKMPQSAAKFGLSIEFDKLNKGERENFYTQVKDPNILRKIAKVMADESEFKDIRGIETATNLFRTDNDKTEFLKTLAKKNTIDAFIVASGRSLMKDPTTGRVLTFDEALEGEVNRRKGKEFLGLVNKDLVTRDPARVSTTNPTGARLKTDAEISADPKIGTRALEFIKLRDLVEKRLKDSKDLEMNLRKNPDITAEQLESVTAFTVSAKIYNQNNLIDLRGV